MASTHVVPEMKEYRVQVGARDIHVAEAGDGQAVIMLHGGGPGASGVSNYSRNIGALAEKFRMIVPDMPGYGQSTKAIDKSDTFGDLAKAILGLMDAMGIAKANVVGNSLGGAAGLRMALEAPERIDRLVLMGPGGIGTTRGAPSKGLKKLLNYYQDDGPTREKLAEFLRDYLVADGSLVSEEMIDARFNASLDPEVVANPPLTRPSGIGAMLRMDLSRDKRIRQIAHPTLTLWGAADKVNKPSGGLWLQKHMRNCDLYMFAGIGHWVQWERAEEFNAVCAAFLSREEG